MTLFNNKTYLANKTGDCQRLIDASPVLRSMDATCDDLPNALEKMGLGRSVETILGWLDGKVITESEEAVKAGEMLGLSAIVNRLAETGPNVSLEDNLPAHTLRGDVVVKAWARGYRIVFDGIIDFMVCPSILMRALRRGMRVTQLQTDKPGLWSYIDEHLALCPDLQVLHAPSHYQDTSVTNEGIRGCRKLKVLDVNNSEHITYCPPWIVELDASGNCGIGDEALKECKKLKKLTISGNQKITRIPDGIMTLVARGNCGVIKKLPESIRHIDAKDNTWIFTLPPLLESLDASGRCTIDDELLDMCPRLTRLDISNNENVTQLPSTLKELVARSSNGGWWTDPELAECPGLVYLDVTGNPGVTVCPPGVETLLASGTGIRVLPDSVRTLEINEQIAIPPSVIRLSFTGKICHVPEWIEELTLSRSSALDVTDLRYCTRLRRLVVDNNTVAKIDWLPESIEEISAARSTSIRIEALAGCVNLKRISVLRNDLLKGFKSPTVEIYEDRPL